MYIQILNITTHIYTQTQIIALIIKTLILGLDNFTLIYHSPNPIYTLFGASHINKCLGWIWFLIIKLLHIARNIKMVFSIYTVEKLQILNVSKPWGILMAFYIAS